MEKITQIKNWLLAHKVRSVIGLAIIVIAIVLIVRATASKTVPTTYILGTVEKGTIVSTVTGTGQVATSNNLAVTPQVSGTIRGIRVTPGQTVIRGQAMFVLDSTDAQKTLRDAKTNLASAQLSLKSYQASLSNSTSTQAVAVARAYQVLLNSTPVAVPADSNTLSYTPPTVSGNYTLGKEGTITLKTYDSVGGTSFNATGLVEGAGLVSTSIPQPVGNSGLLVVFPTKVPSGATWTITLPNVNASNYLSNLNTYQTALQDQIQATQTNGVNDLDLQAKQLSVVQAQNSVMDAENTLAKYYITAPFDGTIASVPVTEGQQASAGTTLGTIITHQQIATIPLNEVDASKVSPGQKATMTFDAIDGLTITGKVAQVDAIGTVTQGVVNYNVKIAFDTEDARVKSGMSVSASIATDVRQDVLMIPSSAVKSSGGTKYVLTATSPTDPNPGQVEITTGISDDTNTEIISGLTEGQSIVTRSVTANATKTAATTAPSILGSVGGNRAGGTGAGAMRAAGTGR